MAELSGQQKKWIDDQIKKQNLNEFGDPTGTMYAGGTPLFNEMTGQVRDRYDYILGNHRDWLPQSSGGK